MKICILSITGISGVGKSTFLRALSSRLTFQNLQASQLIKEGRKVSDNRMISNDLLREVDHDENQLHLVRGFHATADESAALIILDSHSVIEREDRLARISPRVFSEIGIGRMIFLFEQPTVIAQRRSNDSTRSRPLKSAEQLHEVQEAGLAQAKFICQELSIPLNVIGPDQHDEAVQLIISFKLGGE